MVFHKLLKGDSETSRLVRRAGKTGSLPILSPAGTLRLDEVVGQATLPSILFIFVLICLTNSWRFNHEWTWNIICAFGVFVIMLWPTAALWVYTSGTWKVARSSVARSSAVVFWVYWPFCRFAACLAAVIIAYCVGNHLWYNNFRLYIEYHRLQAYDNVDAYTVTGNRMQDAGLVVFNETNGVDRSKAGCIVNGHTFCIAPILQTGVVKPGEKQSRTDINDLFMAGIDCCNCPVTDFRCGDWDDPKGTLGGMRLLDDETRKMYRLAVEKWNVDYQKVSVHSVFFTWVNDPVAAWKELWTRGFQLAVIAAIFGVLGSFLVMVVLNGLMKLLRDLQIAAPLDDGPPTMPGLSLGGAHMDRRSFIPDEYRFYLAQRDPTADGLDDPKYVIL